MCGVERRGWGGGVRGAWGVCLYTVKMFHENTNHKNIDT